MHEATKAPKISFYDYIIVGGGAAGIPLATTLSSNYSVLLLERGGSPYENANITSLFRFGHNFADTSPDSPSQIFTSEGVINTRARVLGGGTSINAGFYSRGEEKFNKEARLMDKKLVLESYEWTEKVMVFKPVVRQWQSAVRAALVEASVTPDDGFTYDHVIGTKVGGTIFDENGTRHTAADLLQYANPKGLSVLLHATAHKILFKKNGRSRPLAYGVVFQDSVGNKHMAYLKGGKKDEIILSAGALGSPQLLMLSGIGPRKQLDALKIKVVLQQPFVGKGMADNPLNAVFIPSPVTVEPSTVQVVGTTRFGSFIEEAGGVSFIFTTAPNYQGFSPQMGGFIFEKINGPLSMGELKIENRNPSDNPSVTFNYFKEPEDLKKCVKGIETILKAVESKAYSKYKYANMTIKDILDLNMKLPGHGFVRSDTYSSLEQYCKDTIRTMWHYHGGCRIGKVVDYEYKVVGVDSLRVIDGSTILSSPGTNPQASVLMLGRYMGVTILGQRLASEK
ncbi:oxygen-dependent choline dehydrogenase, FAD/NAD(P)-binding domain protein [Artemisia annua]|uniref:Oxygen-dependent choline dehydrogenase, FAD/NAD(P)-binding domain protein n=1 Tax=Artemisia annua TaxID=35608 RepID=A0A2U1MZX5_ARTAN|nr:oxygen-dependent choline dehydrogenase, FAD/NAD(P)-binding domain protein [Artemisia annua]